MVRPCAPRISLPSPCSAVSPQGLSYLRTFAHAVPSTWNAFSCPPFTWLVPLTLGSQLNYNWSTPAADLLPLPCALSPPLIVPLAPLSTLILFLGVHWYLLSPALVCELQEGRGCIGPAPWIFTAPSTCLAQTQCPGASLLKGRVNREEQGAQMLSGDLRIIMGCVCLAQVWVSQTLGSRPPRYWQDPPDL